MTDERSVRLFSYGTLQQDGVQRETFGRLLDGSDDAMLGFETTMLEITDPDVIRKSGKRFHPVVRPSADTASQINGKVFAISPAELEQADRYEVSDYKRIEVDLKSGLRAWVYVRA